MIVNAKIYSVLLTISKIKIHVNAYVSNNKNANQILYLIKKNAPAHAPSKPIAQKITYSTQKFVPVNAPKNYTVPPTTYNNQIPVNVFANNNNVNTNLPGVKNYANAFVNHKYVKKITYLTLLPVLVNVKKGPVNPIMNGIPPSVNVYARKNLVRIPVIYLTKILASVNASTKNVKIKIKFSILNHVPVNAKKKIADSTKFLIKISVIADAKTYKNVLLTKILILKLANVNALKK